MESHTDMSIDPLTEMRMCNHIISTDPPQSHKDFATKCLELLPTDLLAEYDDFKDDTDYGSVNDLLDYLYNLQQDFSKCYSYELSFDYPHDYFDFYAQLLDGREKVEREIARIEGAREHYELNLAILYDQFLIEAAQRHGAIGGNGFNIFENIDQDVVEAAKQLKAMAESKWSPGMALLNPRYLFEIAKFWRTLGGKDDRIPIERVWEWVAGSPLRME